MTAVATGLALEGRIVFTYSIGNFPTLRCLEQLRNDACYHQANVNVLAVGGGFSYGPLGMSHHATEDISILRSLPNMSVVVPSEPWQAASVVDEIAYRPGPSYLRIDKSEAGIPAQSGESFRLGTARQVREGADLTIIAVGGILGEVVAAATSLSDLGIECRVIDMCSVKPLDVKVILAAARETGGIVTVEEHNIVGGLGTAVAEACLDNGVNPVFFKRIGLDDTYTEIVGSQQYLRAHYKMDEQSIIDTVLAALSRN